ncbi:hypothetical protein NDU88_006837 [Pleurodeles waltl]|uniref:Uncharacterized protein n=1 Tax=Pleurodeles waltl TaxID=8319 RepID=A0AAV7SQT9_PLEWA|nr:hypothetical protein NDU88_006837 [Pleurodeles waltl]
MWTLLRRGAPEAQPQLQESHPTLLDQPRSSVSRGSRTDLAEMLPGQGSPPEATQPAVMENTKLPQAQLWRRKRGFASVSAKLWIELKTVVEEENEQLICH